MPDMMQQWLDLRPENWMVRQRLSPNEMLTESIEGGILV
jgi:hypothetical protein